MSYAGQILEQSCLMFPLVLGIYVSFTVLKIADLTVDGTLVLGAAVFAKLISTGSSIIIAIFAAVLAGILAGMLVGLIQRHNRIDPLIAGILMAFILNSLSLVVMQRPNIAILELESENFRTILLAILIPSLTIALVFLLMSRLGLWLKAFGNNQDLVAMLGKNPEHLRILGLGLSNGLAALTGCLTAIASGYADIAMGFGQALIGIAMILVGRQLLHVFRRRDITKDLTGIFFSFLGVVLYFVLINEIIRLGLNPVYLKMAIGALLIIFLLLASERAAHSRSTTT